MSGSSAVRNIALVHGELVDLLSAHNMHLIKTLGSSAGVTLGLRGNELMAEGPEEILARLETTVARLDELVGAGIIPEEFDVRQAYKASGRKDNRQNQTANEDRVPVAISAGRVALRAKSSAQASYIAALKTHDLIFATGPAGTGKTYLAMAMAVAAFQARQYERIILTRPAVEAGEKLGFLPGDLSQKVDPYLRPLYDALRDMLEAEQIERLMEKGVIEVAPLAFMRGRTLNRAFIILDEAQNCTREQMKMFLTRLGPQSKAVVTGDATQIDLPHNQPSGLLEALKILRNINEIAFCEFSDADVVRHSLVAKIVRAYGEASSVQPSTVR